MSNRIELWSCGGGRQSVLILGLVKSGRLPKPDAVCMVDTNRERSSTWRYVNAVIRPEVESWGVPFTVIDKTRYAKVDLWGGEDGETLLIPAFSTQATGDGKMDEFCSNEWKTRVVQRWASGQPGWKKRGVNSWLGITHEERHRRRASSCQWLQKRFPLLDDVPCHVSLVYELCERFGWPEPPRSCCWMCPNMGNEEWRTLRDGDPADFAKAVAFDDAIRQRDPHAYVHRSRVPLAVADLETLDAPGMFGGCSTGMCF